MTLAPILAARLIYHNEGFYPDEQVDSGVWKAGSTPHRIAKRLEEKMYSRADAIIALSNRAKTIIEDIPAVRRKRTPVIKVPSCVDLDQFNGYPPDSPAEKDTLRFVYSGSIGGRYIFDDLARFISRASEALGKLHLRVLTFADPVMVGSSLSRSGLARSAWSIDRVAREAIPELLLQQDVGLSFLQQGLSEHGCSPTKIGEYWAAGLPVISTANVSDTDEIIRQERVGVIVREHTNEGYDQAIEELRALLLDPKLRDRCRKAALTHYALEPACERQFALYEQLASNNRSAESGFLRSAASITDER
jgi:glycosyltransferase involved in cell wall biosynthesis